MSGAWRFSVGPAPAPDMGPAATVPTAFVIDGELVQVQPSGVLTVGRFIRGTLHSSDVAYFGDLTIPALDHNNGSKTGAVLGCNVQINVPVATAVSDDNVDQGPLRLALGGVISRAGVMTGVTENSSVIMTSDVQMIPRRMAWTASRP